MLEFISFIIDNIWIITFVIVIVCLMTIKALGKTLGTVAKVILVAIIVAFIAIALGLTTSAELKEWIINLFKETKDYSASEYKDMVNDNYTGEQFLK